MTARGAWRLGATVTWMTLVALAPAPAHAADEQAESSCVRCHLLLADTLKAVADAFANDVHNQAGLGCVACHGGDPNADQPQDAMDTAKGFRGTPAARQIPEICGGCHQDAAFIKPFAPNLPTDQLAQYRTSVHGQRIHAGDTNAATCVSCHGAHGILSVHDTRSPVYPTRVVDTCGSCHADAQRMAPYTIGTSQVDDYKGSVHYRALTVTNDVSAPTCNSCHGAHGATPPGVESVSHVCGTCHSRNLELFRSSPHRQVLTIRGAGACEACHGNHRILSPQDSWLKVEDDGVCARCHTRQDRGGAAAIGMLAALQLAVRTADEANQRVGRAERAGMLMEDARIDLQRAHEEIITARTEVHRASVATVAEHTDLAVKAAEQALASARAAVDEIRYRRTGLLVALALILLAVVALIMMIRHLERPATRQGSGRRR